jgi:chromate transporter
MANEVLARPEAHEGPGGAELTRQHRAEAAPAAAPVVERVSLWQLFRVFFVLGITSFGGGVVAYLREALVVKQRWMDDDTFLSGLELSQTLPGLNATNMSIYMGERLRGVPGALVAVIGMCLPGTVIVMALGMIYASQARSPTMVMVLGGVGAAAVGLTLATTLQIGKKQLAKPLDLSLVVLTFVVIGIFRVSLVTALLTIGPLSIWLYRPRATATDAGTKADAGAPK